MFESINSIELVLYNIFHETISAGAAVTLALVLNGYDIKRNWRKLLLFILITGIGSAKFYLYFPQTPRIIALILMYHLGIKYYFRFSPGKRTVTFFTLFFIFILGKLTFSYLLTLGLGITMYQYYQNPWAILFFPFSYNVPITFLAYLGHKHKWHIFEESETINIPLHYVLPLALQVTLLTIIMTEQLFSYNGQPLGWIQIINFFILIFSLLLTYIFTWRIIKIASWEAEVSALEKLTEELRSKIDVIRTQRHDFINHLQIIAALLKQRHNQELSTYLQEIEKDLSENLK